MRIKALKSDADKPLSANETVVGMPACFHISIAAVFGSTLSAGPKNELHWNLYSNANPLLAVDAKSGLLQNR
jgi:hypothetical protein